MISSTIRAALLVLAGFAPIASANRAEPTKVYESQFGDMLQEWSPRRVEQSPNGKRTFLGGFVNEPVSLSLKKLPPHEYVRVRFDLLILMTWDGSGHEGWDGGGKASVGPDYFSVWVDGGPLLMTQTFSNIPNDEGFKDPTKFQSFPSPVPGELLPAMTGAAEKQTLGYRYAAGPGFDMDSTYHITLLIPHRGDDLTLKFAAPGLQRATAPPKLPDEFWGLDNVIVDAVPAGEIEHPGAEESRTLLDAAIDMRDPLQADAAYEALLSGGDETHKILKEARDAAGIDWADVNKLIAQLTVTDARAAEARDTLSAKGAVIELPLRLASAKAASDASRKQIEDVLGEVLSKPIEDEAQRRASVANRVLQVIGEK